MYKHTQMFRQMLFADTLRGKDSTGLYMVKESGNVEWIKEASPAPTFLNNSEVESALNRLSWKFVMAVGHNRAATIGAKTDENAHPFVEDNIILVHNGTISNKTELNSSVEVDSHAICHAIKEYGIVNALPMIDGAFALAVYDADAKQFYLVRNEKRPLFFAESEDFWIFGSEPWLLHGMAWRNGFKLEKLREVPAGVMYSIKIRDDDDELEFFEEEVSFEKRVFPPRRKRSKGTVTYLPPAKVPSLPPAPVKERQIAKLLKKVINHTPSIPPKTPWSWKENDIVCFLPERSEFVAGVGSTRIYGKHFLFETVEVVCTADVSYTVGQLAATMKADCVVGDVDYVVHKEGNTRIYLKGPAISRPVTSRNNFQVNEELLCALGICHETGCNNEITDDIVEECYVKIRKNGDLSCACPECVEKHLKRNPAWGNILAHDTAKNSAIQTIQ